MVVFGLLVRSKPIPSSRWREILDRSECHHSTDWVTTAGYRRSDRDFSAHQSRKARRHLVSVDIFGRPRRVEDLLRPLASAPKGSLPVRHEPA